LALSPHPDKHGAKAKHPSIESAEMVGKQDRMVV
jgi:hypothetical protein